MFLGCSNGNSPTKVVKKYLEAVQKGDAKTIRETTTPETAQMVITYLEKAQGIVAGYGDKIERTTETIDGDYAVVEIFYTNGNVEEANLVKVDGEWKVILDMSK